jgi:coproporphyrinogen III oxidase-like Fe-S oxidoreductase
MYWSGDVPYLAFGCGAASFLDRYRFTRPKTLTKYYKYVEDGFPMNGEYESE